MLAKFKTYVRRCRLYPFGHDPASGSRRERDHDGCHSPPGGAGACVPQPEHTPCLRPWPLPVGGGVDDAGVRGVLLESGRLPVEAVSLVTRITGGTAGGCSVGSVLAAGPGRR